MASWKFSGLNEYVAQLERLQSTAKETIYSAVYEGSGLVADSIKQAINGLNVNNQYESGGITSVQKKGLQDGFGISPMKDDNDYINVKLGFAGYNGQKTKKYPNGQPNSVIARSINSGSSYRKKNPFVDKATRTSKSACEEKMRNVIDTEIQKLVK